jgi:arsenate reductase-like glutaredoxin family protein
MPFCHDVNDPQITSEMLDDLVHEAASGLASAINNDGKEAQLEFLRERGWTDEDICDALDIPRPA